MAKAKLTWYVPRWAYTNRLWSRLQWLLRAASLARIAIGAGIATAVIIGGLKWALPQLKLPNLLPVVLSLPTMMLTLICQVGLLTLIPPVATVRADKIIVQHGQSGAIIDAKSVTKTSLTFYSDDRVRLRVCFHKKSKPRSRVIGIPPTVDFDRLAKMLPTYPVVHDARHRLFSERMHLVPGEFNPQRMSHEAPGRLLNRTT